MMIGQDIDVGDINFENLFDIHDFRRLLPAHIRRLFQNVSREELRNIMPIELMQALGFHEEDLRNIINRMIEEDQGIDMRGENESSEDEENFFAAFEDEEDFYFDEDVEDVEEVWEENEVDEEAHEDSSSSSSGIDESFHTASSSDSLEFVDNLW
jgi:hypothetical protein